MIYKPWSLRPITSKKKIEGKTCIPTRKSATARETIKALVLLRRCRLLLTRKMTNPFPIIVRMEANQPRTQTQISIFIMVRRSSPMSLSMSFVSFSFYVFLCTSVIFDLSMLNKAKKCQDVLNFNLSISSIKTTWLKNPCQWRHKCRIQIHQPWITIH